MIFLIEEKFATVWDVAESVSFFMLHVHQMHDIVQNKQQMQKQLQLHYV